MKARIEYDENDLPRLWIGDILVKTWMLSEFIPAAQALADQINEQDGWRLIETIDAEKHRTSAAHLFGDGEGWMMCQFFGLWTEDGWIDSVTGRHARPTHWRVMAEPPIEVNR